MKLEHTIDKLLETYSAEAILEYVKTKQVRPMDNPNDGEPCPQGYVKNDKGECVPDVG